MRDKVLARLKGLVVPGQTVICAVSGGADSVAMLHVLLSVGRELQLKIEAAHFNHHLRGAESDRDEAFVRSLCETWNVPLHIGSGDVVSRAEATGESIEEAARKLRYAFFESLGKTVATAHTADDNLETVLLNLLRGTSLKGLCGIPETRGQIIRPMLSATRAEIERYLEENALSHVEDSTNAENDCVRNRLRHQIVPLLKEENPSAAQSVLRMSELLSQDEAYLQGLADEALLRAKSGCAYRCNDLRQLPQTIRTRAIRTMLASIHAPKLSSAHILSVDRLLFSEDPSAAVSLPGSFTAMREYGLLQIRQEPPPASFRPVQIPLNGCVTIPELSLLVRTQRIEKYDPNEKYFSTFLCRYDMIGKSNSLWIRPRATGDAMMLPGGKRSLKKLFIDRKIPLSRRALIPVITDGSQILAVSSVGVSADYLPEAGRCAVSIVFESLGNTEKEEK